MNHPQMIRWEGVPAGLPDPTHRHHPGYSSAAPPPNMQTRRSWAARQEVASATLTSLWRLYLRCSVWELAQATYININKACCWGPPVRGCHRRGQRRDASALTSRLISLSVRPTKKVGISAQSGIAFGSLSLLHDYWTPSSILRLLFSSFSATFPKGGNPWGFKMATHRIRVSLILVTPLVISCHYGDFYIYKSHSILSLSISMNHYKMKCSFKVYKSVCTWFSMTLSSGLKISTLLFSID